MYMIVHCTRLYIVHDCTLYIIIHCTWLYIVHDCTLILYMIVHCTWLYIVHDCTLYMIVQCYELAGCFNSRFHYRTSSMHKQQHPSNSIHACNDNGSPARAWRTSNIPSLNITLSCRSRDSGWMLDALKLSVLNVAKRLLHVQEHCGPRFVLLVIAGRKHAAEQSKFHKGRERQKYWGCTSIAWEQLLCRKHTKPNSARDLH